MHPLHIVAPDPVAHADALFALLDLEWQGIGESLRAGQIAGSHYDWRTARVGLLDDELVTHFGVYDITMRIGTARARAAGVNLVATHPEYRRRGLMAQTGQAAVAAMRAQGYDLSLICNGTAGYYGRFGYVFAWPEVDFVIQTEHLPAQPLDFELRSCATEQRADFAALYNHENEIVTGTAVRPTFPHGKHPGNGRGYFWADASGGTGGYIFCDVHEPSSTLWHDDSAGDVGQRLRALGELARRNGCAQARFERLPYHSAMGRQLRRLSCRIESKYVQDGGWMARIVNLPSLFQKLAPELARRLSRSDLAGWSGELLVAGSGEAITLSVDRGRVRVAPAVDSPHAIEAGDALAQLAIGVDSPDAIVEGGSIRLRGDAGRLLAALFPAQHPQMSNDDL
jgi:predicted N-acetyltransferase YhbS